MIRVAHVAVVIPAANEQARIARCLDAVSTAAEQLHAVRPAVTTDIVVVLDGCTDRTAEIVHNYLRVRTLVTPALGVGLARRAGTDAAAVHTSCPANQVWTAHTDADSVVPSSWLAGMTGYAERGADVVLGTVELDPDDAALSAWRARHGASDGHRHIHGANFGVALDVLVQLGNWSRLRSGEDNELAARAVRAGARVVSVGSIPVRTSARRHGRAPRGFSSYLRALDRDLAETGPLG